jgi:hypothetical protein
VGTERICIAGGITGIAAAAEDMLAFRRVPTGVRVTLEFVTAAQLPTGGEVHICYDIAQNGDWRDCTGVPTLTHTRLLTYPGQPAHPGPLSHRGLQTQPAALTQHPGLHAEAPDYHYHYRLSHWIAAPYVMCFIQPCGPQACATTTRSSKA